MSLYGFFLAYAASEFWLGADTDPDPNPAFDFEADADPDPASSNDAGIRNTERKDFIRMSLKK